MPTSDEYDKQPFYAQFPSVFGAFTIYWRETERGPRVHLVTLPGTNVQVDRIVRGPGGNPGASSCPVVAALAQQIQSSFNGNAVDFSLDIVALEECSPFQRRVLLAEYGIPRGWVSTYGRIAKHLGVPGGARAVGGALSRNPFPIIIPCHRAIRSTGELGGFGGGVAMKRALLELEGIVFSGTGKVMTNKVYY